METIALLFLFGVFIILAYTLGLKNGQKLKNNEEIKIPEINPVKIVRNEIETFEQKKKINLRKKERVISNVGYNTITFFIWYFYNFILYFRA